LQKTPETDSSKSQVPSASKEEIRVKPPKVVVRQNVNTESPKSEPKPIPDNTVNPMMTHSGREMVKPLKYKDFE
jgi:hypothetical protein